MHRAPRVIQPTRAHLMPRARQHAPLAAHRQGVGWHAWVTQAGHPRRSVPEAVWGSRHAARVARRGTRLTSRVPRAPRWVTRHEPMAGLTSLVPRGVRVSRVPAGVRRRSLETAPARRPGVPPEPKPKRTDTPTAERLLHAWADISLPISQQAAGADRLRRLTPWSGGQEAIRQRLGLGATLSQQLAMQAMGT